jgi:hypothetical protein
MQQTADSRKLDPRAWANDERLDAYLDAMAGRTLPPELTELSRWLRYLPGNRAQKHKRRCRLQERFRNDLRRPEPPRPDVVAELSDELAWLQSGTTKREWRLLYQGVVEGLEAVAKSEGMRLGTLKSLLSRCRARLRQTVRQMR